MSFAAAVVLLALQSAPPTAQADSESGLIVGQVIDADSGRPVRGAFVTLGGAVNINPAMPPRVLTGSDGRFVFRGLRAGNYGITATKSGFVDGAYGRLRPGGPTRPFPLADGQRTDTAVVRVWRQAALSGTVTDESGEALVRVRVQAYRQTAISGQRRYLPSGSTLTDDRGIYRIPNLIPGNYIVGAVARHVAMPVSLEARPGTSGLIQTRGAAYVLGEGNITPPPVRDGRLSNYPATFHPNAATGEAATVITLASGSDQGGVDLQVHPVATVSISGQVAGPDGPVPETTLRLVAEGTAEVTLDPDATATTTDRSGRFTFPAVPAGHYSLRLAPARSVPVAPASTGAPSPPALVWVDMPIAIGTEDIENLVVEALPGVRIGGRVQFEGRADRPTAAPTLSIEAADYGFPTVPGMTIVAVRADSSGEFVSPPLPGGRYYVRVRDSPSGWMFKSATSDGRDIVDTPVRVTSDLLNVTATFTNQWSGLRGIVQNRQGPDPSAAVLVFPTDTEAWGSSGANARRVRLLRTTASGEYSVNLPPGEYYVIAVSEAQSADWHDPALIDAASRAAVRLSIAEGERKSQTLTTRELR